jgi:hypothetical protein
MALEAVPAGQASDGRGLVLFVPAIANTNAPTAAELNAGTVKQLTYSLVPDGFRHATTENVINDGRYTLKQVLELPGTVTDTLEVQYVADTPAQTALTEGVTGFIVHRLGVPNETAVAAGQKVDVIPIRAGVQRKVAPTANTLLQRMQKLFVTGVVQRDVAVA